MSGAIEKGLGHDLGCGARHAGEALLKQCSQVVVDPAVSESGPALLFTALQGKYAEAAALFEECEATLEKSPLGHPVLLANAFESHAKVFQSQVREVRSCGVRWLGRGSALCSILPRPWCVAFRISSPCSWACM